MIPTVELDAKFVFYAFSALGIWSVYFITRKLTELRSRAIHAEAIEAGLAEPPSLHPVIDPALCLGCAACTRVCPEGDVIGMVNGKAALIEPAQCIGHGACKEACPRDAITLVFGTATRGVDIPTVGPDFQTNVPGIFIAGELGGMGLIRNAIEQGRQAIDHVCALPGIGKLPMLDVLIVGGGPAGLSASLASIEKRLRFVTIEQECLGGTVAHYPRGKLVMTAPATLPIVGKMNFREVSKEKLLEFWNDAKEQAGLTINYDERVESITPAGEGFVVTTTKQTYNTRSVLLAIGRRGTPRKLGAPGEDHEKVVYRLVDPEQYRNQHVLVVGGGDSALEAAAEIAEQPGTTVTLSYRGDGFNRAKRKNRSRIEAAAKSGRLTLMTESSVKCIHPDSVEISHRGKIRKLPNSAVIVCAGGILPNAFLTKIGIKVETKYGTQ
jgi:thioredoxin reductase (NADPH)